MPSPRSGVAPSGNATRARELVALAVLAAPVLKLTWGIERVRDLPMQDEARYATNGFHLWGALRGHGALPTADWGPGYSLVYALENLVWRDRIRIFDVHWALLVALVCFGLYALARALDQPRGVALVAGALLLPTSFFHVLPYPSHFYLVQLIAGCLIALRCRDAHARAVVMAATFACASFTRPEAAPVALVALAFAIARTPAAARSVGVARASLRVAGAALPPLAMAAFFGNPLGGARAFDAFSQHYAFGVARREHLADNPWMNFGRITARDFGDARTIGAAFVRSPSAFARHVVHNVVELPSNVLDLCSLRANVTDAPSEPLQIVSAVFLVVFAAAFFAALVGAARSRESSPLRVVALFGAGACVAALPGVLLVFPRMHYLVAPCGFALVLAIARFGVWLAPLRRAANPAATAAVAIVAAIALWIATPAALRAPATPMPVRRCMTALRALHLRPTKVLELDIGLAAIAGYDVPAVSGWDKDRPLRRFFADHAFDVVIVAEAFLAHAAFADDPESRAFFDAPESLGFCVAYRDPGAFRILVRPGVAERALAGSPSCVSALR